MLAVQALGLRLRDSTALRRSDEAGKLVGIHTKLRAWTATPTGDSGLLPGAEKPAKCNIKIDNNNRVVSQTGIGKRQKGKGRGISKEKRGGDRGEEEKISNNTTSPGIPDPGRLVNCDGG